MTTADHPRTYGGWRRARSLGIGSLSAGQTVAVIISVLLVIVFFAFDWTIPAVTTACLSAVLVGLILTRRDGVTLAELSLAWARWSWAEWRGENAYRGQVFQELPQAWHLPGVLAPTALLDVEDSSGRVGIVWNQRTGRMSATLLLSPTGALLADRSTVERQVASWGELLATFADDPTVCSAAVTVELTPESGSELSDNVLSRLDPDAPILARQVMEEMVTLVPQRSSRVSARLTVTVDPRYGSSKARSAPLAAAETLRSISGLALPESGAMVHRRATSSDVIRIVRSAFDRGADKCPMDEINELEWGEAGPIATQDRPDYYEHDGSYSMSWALLAAPRQQVSYSVLLPLLSPGRFARRVTMMYRTLSREEAAGVLEREVNAAAARDEYRRRTKRDSTARDRADAQRANRAAMEEAFGAGLVQFCLYVTTTVSSLDDVPLAKNEVEKAAGRAKLKLRLARYGQSAIFAAGLPCGIFPPEFR